MTNNEYAGRLFRHLDMTPRSQRYYEIMRSRSMRAFGRLLPVTKDSHRPNAALLQVAIFTFYSSYLCEFGISAM
jgi:hypothetical protein